MKWPQDAKFVKKRPLNWSFFSSEFGSPVVDQIYILQGYKEGWKDGKFEEKVDFRECLEPVRLHKVVTKILGTWEISKNAVAPSLYLPSVSFQLFYFTHQVLMFFIK
jgi:hypothetical protein